MARQEPGEPFYRVDSPEAQTILDTEGDGAALVDVRRDDEWVTGHAAGCDSHTHRRSVGPGGRAARGKETAVHLRRRCTQRLGLRDGGVDGFRPGDAI